MRTSRPRPSRTPRDEVFTTVHNCVPPWLAPLSAESRAAIAVGVADWPDLTPRQLGRLRLLFRRRPGGDAA